MSAKKSFDVRRNPERGQSVRTARKSGERRSNKTPVRGGKPEPLKLRRHREGMLAVWLSAFSVLVILGGGIYASWRPEVRIQNVRAPDAYQTAFSNISERVFSGTYGGILPRDSIFFYPLREFREAILHAHPEISALSIHRASFSELRVEASLRTTAFWWCGTPTVAAATDETCYKADGEGFIFAKLPVEAYMGTTTATSSLPLATTLRLYAEIDTSLSTDSSPLRSRMKDLSELPDILVFVKELKSLNLLPVSLAVRGDEADLFLPSGTRLTYVIGDEESALALLATTYTELNLADGSILYVDLRFPGKVYLKRRGE